MIRESLNERRAVAIAELSAVTTNPDTETVVRSLIHGLDQIRDLFLQRTHEDIERTMTMDSMQFPASIRQEVKQHENALREIEIFSCLMANDEFTSEHYLECEPDWFLNWLLKLHVGGEHASFVQSRIEDYRAPSTMARRQKFMSHLQQAIPESFRAPLVLFRMFPRASKIVVAVAFGNTQRAHRLRKEQHEILPAIRDCSVCKGQVLENGEKCRVCSNPIWGFQWLEAV